MLGRPSLRTGFNSLVVVSAEPTHSGAGDSASQGYRFDLLQDVADLGHHILTIGAHVPGMAGGSTCTT